MKRRNLAACPFCGSDCIQTEINVPVRVARLCWDCGAKGPYVVLKKSCIGRDLTAREKRAVADAWNRREAQR